MTLTIMDVSLAFKLFLIFASVAIVCALLLYTNLFEGFKKTSEAETSEPLSADFPDDVPRESLLQNEPLPDQLLEALLQDVFPAEWSSKWQYPEHLRRALRINIRRYAIDHMKKMAPVQQFIQQTARHRSIEEQIELTNIEARHEHKEICGAKSPVGYICSLKPNHEGRHSLKLGGESFLFWDDDSRKQKDAKAMQPPV